ncbi:aldehyde dehydrogenase family 3 member H1 isoform X1 [Rosa rugosa]|uniref:aldehyde dehydrogenase family 3 member H1 isoform X1 n=1 Tax=Rosa rugosa TaxID=74645 RepID=UPI002B407FCF|nr:aldehyde dehydrogenase family 3 member H1 isoform X1 [Rosa rugosa]
MDTAEVVQKVVFDSGEAATMVEELRASYRSGKTRSYEWRVSQLQKLEKVTEFHEQEIVEALRSDLSKPEFEAFVQEIGMLKSSCKLAIKQLKSWMKPEKAKTSITTFPSSAEIVSEPLGVVLIISAWNYPFLLSLDPVVGAIAAGNAVVLKPSELAPATSSLLAKLLGEYMDSSSVRVVEGAVAETSALLEQKWDKICYTGNGRVGRIVMASAAKHLTPVLLELGGKSPVVVDSGINLQVASRRIIVGKWGCNNGQACISPDYILTTKDFASKLVDALKSELDNFYGKNPLQSKDLSRIVNSNHYARLTKLLDEDKVSGKVIHGGERDTSNLRIAPTILLDVPQDSLIMQEEIFGPLLPIITVDKIEDSFDLITSGTKPLAAYLFTNNQKLKDHFVRNISAGGLVINDTTVHLAVPSLPFGGVGESGMGAYHGKFSFEAFSHKKAVVYRGFSGDASVRYPPYTKGKLRLLKALVGGSLLGIIRALFGWSKA